MLIRGMTHARIGGGRVDAIASRVPLLAGVNTALDGSQYKAVRTAPFDYCAGSPEGFNNDG